MMTTVLVMLALMFLAACLMLRVILDQAEEIESLKEMRDLENAVASPWGGGVGRGTVIYRKDGSTRDVS